MSDSDQKDPAPVVPVVQATDLLAYNPTQFVEFLEKNANRPNSQGGYDVTGLEGVERLSRPQKLELAGKVRAALDQIGNKKLSQPVAADDLFTRLTSLADADKRDGEPSRSRRLSDSSSDTSWHTQLPTGTPHSRWLEKQEAMHRGLVADGCRPICSVEHISHCIATSTIDLECASPWVFVYPHSEDKMAWAYCVLWRQFDRWWEFRKSQWDNRGLGDSEEAPDAYVAAHRLQCGGGVVGEVFTKTFFRRLAAGDRQQWKSMPVELQLPGQTFSDYSAAVEHRLALYQFARPIQLQRDPRHQTQWTDWLEYLNYELWDLEQQTADMPRLVNRLGIAITGLRKIAFGNKKKYLEKPLATNVIDVTEEAEGMRAALDATEKRIWEMVEEAREYRQAERLLRLHRSRIDWIIKEARVMETEMAQEDRQQDKKSPLDLNQKRKHDDESNEPPLENHSKRPRRSDDTETGLGPTGSEPQLRQSTRLTQEKSVA
ncbi:hypothetical protein F5Y14DRAFT_423219 [Nemania sp. NC0429]|nr:hypothetical protein F5Y14DRAFT_423219 [Nemania sp. NC0429]